MGGSSGGEGRTPYEAPDSGRSTQQVKIVEVISEGEIQGLVNGAKSVFLDNTPIQAEDDSYNFTNIETAGRIGSQDQAVMVGFDTTEKEISVGAEVRKRMPLTRTITDGKVTRLRLTLGVSALFRQEDNGDTLGTTVDFKITVGSRVYSLSINGKYSSQYLRNLVIDNLPPVPFTVKVERMQDDSKSQRLQNKTIWASYTEIIDTEFAYPNTALVGIKFDSDYFANVPTRSYEIYGIKIKVPSNYDPVTRTYSGLWDGTFKIAYSDNPALILMDIVTNKRYGLGQRLGEFGVDKWALYQAAQYCDQMIPDGYGGTRPRFTCNVWMTEQRSAYDVINDICSIFRAMPVWNGTALTVIMDRPSDPVWTYTNANVINGEFSRQYSAVKARHNAIQVEYQDAANNYEKAIEYVSNDDDIRKYGLNLKKVVAFGCTNRGQAYCTGRWILETERLETETITFSVGSEGLMHIPGDIIRVSDNNYAGTDIGGRVLSFNGRTVTLDREIQLNGNSYFSYINAEAKHSNILILRAKGNVITLDSEPVGLTDTSIWSLATQTITSRLYRAMSITENDNGSYTIVALQHEPQKETIVDNGTVFEPVNTTLHQAPKVEHLDVDLTSGNAKLTWQTTSGVGTVTYDVRILKAGKLYAQYKGLTISEVAFDNLPDGEYQIVIQAKNASGQIVSEKSKTFTINRPPVPQNVQVFGGLSEISLAWDYVDNVTQTEIWASETNDIHTAKRIAKVLASFYSHAVGARQTRYYWLRHTRGQNVGDFYQQQGLRAETGADIDEELRLLNEKLSEPIINQVFDVAAPARRLEMILTVDNITNPSHFLNHKQLYNEADGKLWSWNKTKNRYEPEGSEILASAIKGIIQPNQLAGIPTSKLSGKVTDEMLQSVSANKLAGVLSANQLPAIPTTKLSGVVTDSQIQSLNASKLLGSLTVAQIPSMPTNKLTGLLSDAQIQSLNAIKLTGSIDLGRLPSIPTSKLSGKISSEMLQSVSAAKIDGTIDLGKIPSIPTTKLGGVLGLNQLPNLPTNKITGTFSTSQLPSIPTNKLTGTLTDAQLQGISASKLIGTISVNQLASIPTTKLTGQISANQLSANSVGANVIQANAIGSQHIQANSIDAGKIRANTIGAEHINARAITASKMKLYGENMILDPMFEDKLYWRENISTLSECEWADGKITITIRNKSVSSGTYFYGLRQALNLPLDRGRSYRLQCKVKVTGDSSIDKLHTAAYIVTYPETTARNRANDWVNIGGGGKFGARDELVISEAKSAHIRDGHNQIGVYLRVGSKATGDIITNATVEFSEIELIKMADADLIVDGSISAEKVATNAIQTKHLTANVITAEKIQANAIGVNHLGANVVTAEKIQAGAVNAQKIASSAIEAGHIKANAIASNHIQSNAITADKILANSIDGNKIRANAITADKVATNAISSDKIQANAISSQKMVSGAVTAREIATNAVTADKILAGSIQSQKIASNAIQATHISANAVTANAIQAGVIGATHIASNSIDATKIKANSIGANAIQASAISTAHIQANAIDAGKIKAGAINANHLQAGQISTDKLAVGLGGNLLYNPIFANNGDGWTTSNGNYTGGTINRRYFSKGTSNWEFKNPISDEERLAVVTFNENITSTKNQWADVVRQKIHLIPNQWYIFSAYVNTYRCTGIMLVEELRADGSYVRAINTSPIHNRGSFINGIDGDSRNFVKFRCPASGYVEVMVRVTSLSARNPDVYVARPMLEECTEHTTQPSAWVNAGITAIHGGSIKTRTITAQQIAANTITSNEIIANAINAKHIATGTINAQHIHTRAISADKLNIQSLSAISANLGTVNAGTIQGTTISGNTITGNTVSGGTITGTTISGTTINGGNISGSNISGVTIRGSYLEGATGSFTGTLTVGQLIGSNILEVVT